MSGIPPSRSPQAILLRLSICCQPRMSARNYFSRLLRELKHLCALFTFGNGLVQVLWLPEFTLPVEGTHIVEKNATLVRWHVEKFNMCTCFCHKLWEDRSAIIKPCLCEIVVRSGTVHLVRLGSSVSSIVRTCHSVETTRSREAGVNSSGRKRLPRL